MSQVGFFFYPGDWLKDTRVLTLQCRGAWIDLLCELCQRGGSVKLLMADYARILSCDVNTADAIVRELSRLNTADVTWHDDGYVTVECRRIKREFLTRENNRLRKQAERQRKQRHRHVTRHVTAKSKPSSESESESLNLNNVSKDTFVDKAKKPELTVKDLVDSWNECFAGKLPAVEWPLSTSRHRKASLRIREHQSTDFWNRVFGNISDSAFLLGKNNGAWRCTIDFLINNDSNCIKVYEGAYSNGQNHR